MTETEDKINIKDSHDVDMLAINIEKLAEVYPEAVDPYLAILGKIDSLSKELKENPAGEAKGIAFCDVHGLAKDNSGKVQMVTIHVTARSNVDAVSAVDNLVEAIKHCEKEYNFHIFKPIINVNNRNHSMVVPKDGTVQPADGQIIVGESLANNDEPEF